MPLLFKYQSRNLKKPYRLTELPKLALLLIMLFNSLGIIAQGRTDTISKVSYTDTTSWVYKMETSGEKWSRLEAKKDFQVFTKWERTNLRKASGPAASVSYYGGSTLVWLNDINEIELAAAGITPKNAHEFIYHVIQNDSLEVVPWTKPKNFRTNKNITYAYFGKFDTYKKILRLEVYNLNHYYDKKVVTFNGLYMPAAKIKFATLNYTNQYLFKPHMQHVIPSNKQHFYGEEDWKNGKISFKWSDSINHLLIAIQPTLQNDMYSVYLKRIIDKKVDTVYVSNAWEMSYYGKEPSLRINASYFNKPGSYEILVVPEAPEGFKRNSMANGVRIPFNVLPSETKLFTSKQVMMYTGSLLLVPSIIFGFYYTRSKRRLSEEARQKEIANLQLSSVRSQLNALYV